ncbi:hypothetical protein O6H91_17G082700 [Diphasiastrum complanatum]|uniref:Uncharacterized protein n=1 Tax=Diphasiastrum complanatum TaxID=34168 RepID=A0ACC2B8I0_DIPCM|nr:hypothetical protein O6H91_17G082700 [Diphasiastrum complanatum]
MEGPSSADVAQVQSSFLGQSTVSCSLCLDAVNDVGERSIAKLKCGHHFHLECIGSAFNAKGSMQCPNCRCIEEGQWLYANGSPRLQNSSMDGLEEGDLFAGIIDILQSNEDYHRRQVHAGSHLPFGSPPTYQYLTLVFERTNAPPSAYAEYVAHVLYSQQRSLSASAHTCPYLATQRTSFDESVTASYGRAELSSPLQNRRHDGNSARMQTVHLSEGGTRSSGGAGNLHSSRSVAEIDSADSTIFPNHVTGNHVAANHGGVSMQFGQTGLVILLLSPMFPFQTRLE